MHIPHYPGDRTIENEAKAYASAVVLPAYVGHPRYIGSIQWITGPNIRLIDQVGLRAGLVTLRPKHGKELFHFRIFWHGQEMDTFTQRGIDEAILKCFKALCNNYKVKLAFDNPFQSDLDDPERALGIIRTFEAAFINLDNVPRETDNARQ